MFMLKRQRSQAAGGLLTCLSILTPLVSQAHARLDMPPARDAGKVGSDAHKDPTGPCGNIAPTTSPVTYQSGSAIQVQWTETVNHPGCFLIGLSTKMNPTAQTDFTQIANIKHSTQGAVPRPYTATVQLPAGVICSQCTLQLRQIMLAAETDPCPPATIASGATYYTCADVTLTAPAAPDLGTTPLDMAQPTSSPDLSVTMMTPDPGAMSTGCQASGVPLAGSGSLALLLGSVALLLRRRRA